MIDTLIYKGKWQIPTSENWLNGILQFNPEDGARLEVFGTFGNNPLDNTAPEIIIGETNFGGVTLLENHYKTTSSNLNNTTITVYEPIFIISGYCFESIEKVEFRKVGFEIFNLFEWLNYTGNKFDCNQNQSDYALSYKAPNNIDFEYYKDCQGSISFTSHIKLGNVLGNIEINEQCFVAFSYTKKNSFKNILNDIGVFVGFITLATFEQSYPLSITFQDDVLMYEANNQLYKLNIKCLFKHSAFNRKHKNRRKFEHLLGYNEIQNDFPGIIQNWYKSYSYIKPSFELLLYSFREKYSFSVEKFMDIVRAIETFHRLTRKNQRIPEEPFKALKHTILTAVKLNSADKVWLNDLLNHANEPTLKDRLLDLIENYSNSYLQNNVKDVAKFCKKVKDSRHYYTHYDPKQKSKALTGKVLFEHYQRLLGLLISCIFNHIGLHQTSFEKGLTNNLA